MILGEKEAVKHKDKYKLWEVKKGAVTLRFLIIKATASFILYLLICELLSICVDAVDYPTYKAKTSFIYISDFKELNPSKYLKNMR